MHYFNIVGENAKVSCSVLIYTALKSEIKIVFSKEKKREREKVIFHVNIRVIISEYFWLNHDEKFSLDPTRQYRIIEGSSRIRLCEIILLCYAGLIYTFVRATRPLYNIAFYATVNETLSIRVLSLDTMSTETFFASPRYSSYLFIFIR